jgi:hypothetical protein
VCLALLGCVHVSAGSASSVNQEQEQEQEQEQPPSPTDFQVAPLPIEGEMPLNAEPVFGEINPALQPLIEVAQQDLGARLGMANWWDIGVLEARAVTWPDGGLGCPEPDMAYIQILVDGSLIRLWADSKEYEYHSGGTRAPFLCMHPVPPPAIPPGGGGAV